MKLRIMSIDFHEGHEELGMLSTNLTPLFHFVRTPASTLMDQGCRSMFRQPTQPVTPCHRLVREADPLRLDVPVLVHYLTSEEVG